MVGNRIKLKLIDINPKQVVEVFNIISEFTNLEANPLKESRDLKTIIREKQMPIEVKRFMLFYIKEHLNINNAKSHYYKQHKNKEKQYTLFKKIGILGEIEDLKDFPKWSSKVKIYTAKISQICDEYLNSSLQISNPKSSNMFKLSEDDIQTIRQWEKLPISSKKGKSNNFKKVVITIFEDLLPIEDIDKIIENSFCTNHFKTPIEILNIDYPKGIKIEDINGAFYKLFELYENSQSRYLDESIKKSATSQNSEEMQNYKEEYPLIYSSKNFLDEDLYKNATDKINMAKIMFISFNKIRLNYYNSNNTLEKHLQNVCQNIVIR